MVDVWNRVVTLDFIIKAMPGLEDVRNVLHTAQPVHHQHSAVLALMDLKFNSSI